MINDKRISETVIYEIYIDLWNFTPEWAESIANKLSEFYDGGENLTYINPSVNMSFRLQSENKETIDKIRARFNSLSNIAKTV